MEIGTYYDKLLKSKEYKDFIKKNEKAYLCSCFFMLDKENNTSEIHFDFFISSDNKMFSFKINSEINLMPLEVFDKNIPEKLILDKKIELDDFEKLIIERMEKEDIKETPKKFLYSFQSAKGKNLLLATIFLSKMAILKVSFDFSTKKIIDFDKKSFFDIISFVKK